MVSSGFIWFHRVNVVLIGSLGVLECLNRDAEGVGVASAGDPCVLWTCHRGGWGAGTGLSGSCGMQAAINQHAVPPWPVSAGRLGQPKVLRLPRSLGQTGLIRPGR